MRGSFFVPLRLRRAILTALVVVVTTTPSVPHAQYIYLDANGDGVNTEADQLQPAGEPATILVYLDTSHNADGSPAICQTSPDAMTINSYEFIISASGGTVSYGGFSNHRLGMNLSLGPESDEISFYAGQAGPAALPPGLYDLASVTVLVESGTPSLDFAASTTLSGHYGTSFGSACSGTDQDNTLKLGLDWHDTAGCGPPGGGNAAPAGVAAALISIQHGQPVGFAAEFSDFNSGDSLNVRVEGLPPGLVPVEGIEFSGKKQIRVYGLLDDSVPEGTRARVFWTASDGRLSTTTDTELKVGAPYSADPQTLRDRVEDLISVRYSHGMSSFKARALGSRSLPILSSMLRDPANRGSWALIVQAIAAIGDTAYFDTLRTFVWERFKGPQDSPTVMAIGLAQGALGTIATISPRALEYLISSSRDSYWVNLPWILRGRRADELRDLMVRETLLALSYTDAARADSILGAVPLPSDTTSAGGKYRAGFVRSLTRVHAKVRRRGYLSLWSEQDAVREGRP